MGQTHRFRPGRARYRAFNLPALALVCLSIAVIRTGLDLAFYFHGDIAPGQIKNGLRLAAWFVPVYLLFRATKAGRGIALSLAGFSYAIGSSCLGAVYFASSLMVALGLWSPFADPVLYYSLGGALMAPALFLGIRGAWRFLVHLSWRLRIWSMPRPSLWLLPFIDAGTGTAFAALIAAASYGMTSWPLRLTSSPWPVLDAAAVALMFVSAAIETVLNRSGHPDGAPGGMTLVEERTWRCRALDTEYVPVPPTDELLVSDALWRDGPLLLVRAARALGSQWIVVGGDVVGSKQAWRLPAAIFDVMRPDLSPLLGLGPGWVVTTAPPEIKHDPALAQRVAAIVDRCEVSELPERTLRDQIALVSAVS